MTRTDVYQKHAAECRDLASTTSDLETKAQWLKLAEEWSRMETAAYSHPDAFDAK